MGIDDSGSVDIATNDAVLLDDLVRPNAGFYMGCRCQDWRLQATPGIAAIWHRTCLEIYASHMPSDRSSRPPFGTAGP